MATVVYKVNRGERIEDISAKFGVSASAILHDNNCTSEQIDEGVRIVISKPDGREYIVKPFDTIASIAISCGVREQFIRDNNNLTGEVFIGQKIYI
ncbi:MAG: LysM peptidoglycan-binding domain-containing protein [Clostridia bacterium]|nr:LysM peptidoglycan-binding domain-containing protein [Clostridia bacterium]